MKVLTYTYPTSSFLSIEKDTTTIVKRMLTDERLKKLLKYNTTDALDQDDLTEAESLLLLKEHTETVGDNTTVTVPALIKFVPKVYVDEAKVNYIIISFDNFSTNINNPEFRDCTVQFDIVCHYDLWYLNDFQLRPYKIAAEIDSLFNNQKLSGIGTLSFEGASSFTIQGQEFAGVSLLYSATHGEDDKHWFDYETRPVSDDDLEENFNNVFNQ